MPLQGYAPQRKVSNQHELSTWQPKYSRYGSHKDSNTNDNKVPNPAPKILKKKRSAVSLSLSPTTENALWDERKTFFRMNRKYSNPTDD